MLLRVIRGTVSVGREADFVAECRRQVAGGARLPGLGAFFAGYRRVDGADRFIRAATWDSEEDAVRGAGTEGSPRAADALAGLATVETVDVYTVLGPVYRGIVDAPGGVVRVTTARAQRTERDRMLAWLVNLSRDRSRSVERFLLGWSIAERPAGKGDESEVIAISAWPSPLVIDAVADPDRRGAPLYAAVDQFISDAHVEQFRAIGLELPDELSDVGSRRLVAARFASRDAADSAASALSAAVASPGEAQISVAPLGEPGTSSDAHSFVLVARVAIGEYAAAERLIGDHDGDVILSQREAGTAGNAVETGNAAEAGDAAVEDDKAEADASANPTLSQGFSPAQ